MGTNVEWAEAKRCLSREFVTPEDFADEDDMLFDVDRKAEQYGIVIDSGGHLTLVYGSVEDLEALVTQAASLVEEARKHRESDCSLDGLGAVSHEALTPVLGLLRVARDEKNDWRAALEDAEGQLADLIYAPDEATTPVLVPLTYWGNGNGITHQVRRLSYVHTPASAEPSLGVRTICGQLVAGLQRAFQHEGTPCKVCEAGGSNEIALIHSGLGTRWRLP